MDPEKHWIPLKWITETIYPQIKHPVWTAYSVDAQEEFHKWFTKMASYNKMTRTEQAAVCLIKSIEFVVSPLVQTLSNMEKFAFWKMMGKIVGALDHFTIESIIMKGQYHHGDENESYNLFETNPAVYFNQYHYSELKDSYPLDLFMNQVHLLTLLCGYLFDLNTNYTVQHDVAVPIYEVLQSLSRWVCCANKEWMNMEEGDVHELILQNCLKKCPCTQSGEYHGGDGKMFEFDEPDLIEEEECADENFQLLVDTLMRGSRATFETSSWLALSQSLVFVLGLHHKRYKLSCESPIALFRIESIWGKNQTRFKLSGSKEYNFDTLRHPVQMLCVKIPLNKRIRELSMEEDAIRDVTKTKSIDILKTYEKTRIAEFEELNQSSHESDSLFVGSPFELTQSLDRHVISSVRMFGEVDDSDDEKDQTNSNGVLSMYEIVPKFGGGGVSRNPKSEIEIQYPVIIPQIVVCNPSDLAIILDNMQNYNLSENMNSHTAPGRYYNKYGSMETLALQMSFL